MMKVAKVGMFGSQRPQKNAIFDILEITDTDD
jgi:hypothetical protein